MDATPHSGLDARSAELLAHAAWLRPLARSLVRDGAAAEDVLQETWLAALRAAPSEPRRVKPWLAHVLANVARRTHRSETRRVRRERAVARAEELADSSDTVARIDAQRVLAAAVAALPEPYRRTIVLRYFDGLDASAIARSENIAPSTVRSRVAHGLELLRAELDRRAGGDRDAWAFALAPFVPCGAADIAQVAVSATGGVLVVNTLSRVVVGVAFVALGFWVYVAREDSALEHVDSAHIVANAVALNTDTPSIGEDAVGPEGERVSAVLASGADPSAPSASTAAHVSIRGMLVDELRRPIAGATFALDVAGSLPATSGADGRFTSLVPEIPGPYRDGVVARGFGRAEYVARAPARATVLGSLQLETGADLELGEIVLAPGATLRGRVLDADGAPRSDAWVVCLPLEEWPALDVVRALGPPSEGSLAWVRTGDAGEFVIDGARTGMVRVGAQAPGRAWTVTEPLDAMSGAANAHVELRLAWPLDTERLRGRVLDPGGAPIAAARVTRVAWLREHSRTDTATTDADGRFEFLAALGARARLTAQDPSGVLLPAELSLDAPPAGEVELRFGAVTPCELHANDETGAPLTSFAVVIDEAGAKQRRVGGKAGLARFPLRRGSVTMRAESTGRRSADLGTFVVAEAELAPTCVLPLAPAVRGIVLANGVPVAGAHVRLHALIPTGLQPGVNGAAGGYRRGEFDGYPTPIAAASGGARTSADGHFVITPKSAGDFALLCEAPGFARAEVELAAYELAAGRDGVIIALDVGGTLEGDVTAAPGRSSAGALVALDRGDGQPRVVRADEHGHYRVEHLTPGRWNVTLARAPLTIQGPSSVSSLGGTTMVRTFAAEPPPFPTNCTVESGRTTRVDLVAVHAELELAVTIDGRPASGWRCVLRSEDEDWLDANASITTIDGAGRARLSVATLADRRLTLTPVAEFAAEYMPLTSFPALTNGVRSEALDLRYGAIAGHVVRAGEPGHVEWSWPTRAVPGALTWSSSGSVDVAADGSFRAPRVPATAISPGGDVQLRWTVLRSDGQPAVRTRIVRVDPGATLDVELD